MLMKELPSSYVITQDTRALFERINQAELSGDFLVAVERYFDKLQTIISSSLDSNVALTAYEETDIEKRVSDAVRTELRSDPTTYCICLDRFLLSDVAEEFPERFFRFSVTRTIDGNKVPRSRDPSFPKQIKNLLQTIPEANTKPAILVDDGIFSGGTVQDMVQMLRSSGTPIKVKSVIGFIGSTDKQNGATILEPVENLYEWVDMRDFTPLGGKTVSTSKNNRIASAAPYLYPWSLGEGASFDTSPTLFTMSRGAILGFQELVRSFEQQYGRPLRFRELVKAGFTLPVSTVDKDDLVVSLNDRVIDYLNRCIQKINKEQRRTVCLFDMDGTLYRLDGVGSGYAGSSLEKRVRNNATAFIAAQENCSFDQANVVYESGIADRIGLSSYLSRRYDISRSDYFDTVWNIDPSPIVEQYEIPVRVLRELKQSTVKPVLLTSAPRVWMKRVLETLEIDNVFELTYSGEQFGTKSEIFARLAGWYTPTNIISIGDQEQTDIAPAKAYGFRTLLVSSPADVQNLLEAI